MKKIILILAVAFGIVSYSDAQIMRADELENYAKEKFGDNWVDAATNLGNELQLDKNNAITYTQVIEAAGKSKDQLYVLLNYWYSATFNDANSVIQLNDKELGAIIAQGYVGNIAQHVGGENSYNVSIKPVIKCDIKDGKIRVTYTVPFYVADVMAGGGWVGALSGARATHVQQNWVLDKCFPFAEKDKHKKTSSKALVMAHAYSNVIMDKIEEAVKNGLSGNEGDDW